MSKINENKVIKFLKNKILWNSVLIGFLGFVASFFLTITDLFRFDTEVVLSVMTEYGDLMAIRVLVAGIYGFIISMISFIFGSYLYPKIVTENKKISKIDTKGIIILIIGGLLIPFILCCLDKFLYTGVIEGFVSIQFNLFNIFSTSLYNGVIEELWFRYGLMSVIIYAIYKVVGKKDKIISENIKIVGSVLTSLLLFALQLHSVLNLYTVFSLAVVIRAILLYLIMNLLYSYCCINYSIKFSILVHVLFIIFFIGVFPLIFSLI